MTKSINIRGNSGIRRMQNHQIANLCLLPFIWIFYIWSFEKVKENAIVMFLFFTIAFSLIYLFVGVLIPLRTVYYLSKSIRLIRVLDDRCVLITSKILWVKERVVDIPLEELKLMNYNFSIYESKPLNGTMILDCRSGQKYHLVESFYDDYEKIIEKLSA